MKGRKVKVMPRKLSCRYVLKARLEAQTAIHVGGLESGFEDMTVALNGNGKPYIPGTSLVGAIKAWLARESMDTSFWGSEGDTGSASSVCMEDAIITLPSGSSMQIRDGVGINRVTGTAAYQAKYDMTVLPRGSRFTIGITVDIAEGGDCSGCESMLKHLANGLMHGLIRFGACKTRGLGEVKIAQGKEASLKKFDIGTREGMIAFLSDKAGVDVPVDQTDISRSVIININWNPAGPMMVRAGYDGIVVDSIPLLEPTNEKGELALLLPGSSIKGAMRTRAEKIVRTMLGDDAIPIDFLDQVKTPLADLLFGAAAETENSSSSHDPENHLSLSVRVYKIKPGSGSASFADCYGVEKIPSSEWVEVANATDEEALNNVVDKRCKPRFQEAYHTAIDRWTNAVNKSALYQVLEPHLAEWEPIRIVVDTSRLRKAMASCADSIANNSDNSHPANAQSNANLNPIAACHALLLFTLRDFSRGDIPLGFAVNRGMGDISVTNIKITGGGLDCEIKNGVIFTKMDMVALKSAWNEALEALKREGEKTCAA